MHQLEWFRFRIGSERWRVVFCELPDAYGTCVWANCTIRIDVREPAAVQDRKLGHELAHAAFGEPRTQRQHRRHEREVTTRYEPRLYPALRSMGFRWPSRPTGYAAFRRAALRRQRLRGSA